MRNLPWLVTVWDRRGGSKRDESSLTFMGEKNMRNRRNKQIRNKYKKEEIEIQFYLE